tara:strand:- start:356 stop:568 length:213 start_codon:yes stop_codon:yes gene_type:complete
MKTYKVTEKFLCTAKCSDEAIDLWNQIEQLTRNFYSQVKKDQPSFKSKDLKEMLAHELVSTISIENDWSE